MEKPKGKKNSYKKKESMTTINTKRSDQTKETIKRSYMKPKKPKLKQKSLSKSKLKKDRSLEIYKIFPNTNPILNKKQKNHRKFRSPNINKYKKIKNEEKPLKNLIKIVGPKIKLNKKEKFKNKIKKSLSPKNFEEREKMFYYNNGLISKNIPYKNLLNKFKKNENFQDDKKNLNELKKQNIENDYRYKYNYYQPIKKRFSKSAEIYNKKKIGKNLDNKESHKNLKDVYNLKNKNYDFKKNNSKNDFDLKKKRNLKNKSDLKKPSLKNYPGFEKKHPKIDLRDNKKKLKKDEKLKKKKSQDIINVNKLDNSFYFKKNMPKKINNPEIYQISLNNDNSINEPYNEIFENEKSFDYKNYFEKEKKNENDNNFHKIKPFSSINDNLTNKKDEKNYNESINKNSNLSFLKNNEKVFSEDFEFFINKNINASRSEFEIPPKYDYFDSLNINENKLNLEYISKNPEEINIKKGKLNKISSKNNLQKQKNKNFEISSINKEKKISKSNKKQKPENKKISNLNEKIKKIFKEKKKSNSINLIKSKSVANLETENNFENSEKFNKNINLIINLLAENSHINPESYLMNLPKKYNGLKKIEIFKLISLIFKKKKNYEKSIEILKEGILSLKDNEDFQKLTDLEKDQIKKSFFLEISSNNIFLENPENSLKILKSNIFLENKTNPYFYYVLLGDTYIMLKEKKKGLENYKISLEYFFYNIFQIDIEKFKEILEKIFLVFIKLEDYLDLVCFYDYLITKIEKLKNVGNLDFYYYWIIKINLWILEFLKNKKNIRFLDFLLYRIIEANYINFKFLTDEKKVFLSKLYFEFSELLKSDFENLKKNQNKYIKYLLFSLKIINQIKTQNETEEIVYLLYIIKFNIGIYYKNIKNYPVSKTYFEKSLVLFEKLKDKKIQEKIVIIFYLAIILFKLKDYQNSKIFFEKILDKKIKDNKLKNECYNYLVKIYFFLEENKNCRKICNLYFEKNKQNKINYIFIIFYVISIGRDIIDFNTILKELKNLENKLEFGKKIENEKNLNRTSMIFKFIRNMLIYYKKNKIQNEEFLIFNNFQNFNQKFDLEIAEDFLKNISYLYYLFIFEKKDKNYYQILHELVKDKNDDEISEVFYFLRIIYLFFCFYIKFLKRSKKCLTFQNFFENFKDLKNRDILKTIKKFKIKKIEKKKKINFTKEKLKTWDLKNKKRCSCYKKIKNSKILNLIEKFFYQIKNMLFLNLTEKILDYYNEFEKIIIEEKYNIKNFDYIPKLFNLLKISEKSKYFNRIEFFEKLDDIINENTCIHDYEIIFLLFESFRNKNFIENAIFFVHKNYPILAGFLFKTLFFENFKEKFKMIIEEYLNFSKKPNFSIIENTPLIHNLLSSKILQIPKNQTYHFFYKFRYFSLNQKNLEDIFKFYFSEFEIMSFKIQFQFYLFFVKIIRKKINALEIVNHFEDRIFYFLKIYKNKFLEVEYIFYALLTFVNLLNFRNNEKKISNKIFSIIKRIFDYCKKKDFSDFIISSNLIGNIFYKNSIFDLTKEIKTMINSLIKKEKIILTLPNFLKQKKNKQINYDIITYLLMSSIYLKNKKKTEYYFEIFENLKPTGNKFLKIEKIFIKIEYLKFLKTPKTINTLLNSAERRFKKFTSFEKNIFQALFYKNKIDLDKINNNSVLDKSFSRKRNNSIKFVHDYLKTGNTLL